MTLLIAVADLQHDAELIASARGLAAAAGRETRIIQVHETEGPERRVPAASEVTALKGDAEKRVVEVLAAGDVDCLAIALGTINGSGVGHGARALLERFS